MNRERTAPFRPVNHGKLSKSLSLQIAGWYGFAFSRPPACRQRKTREAGAESLFPGCPWEQKARTQAVSGIADLLGAKRSVCGLRLATHLGS